MLVLSLVCILSGVVLPAEAHGQRRDLTWELALSQDPLAGVGAPQGALEWSPHSVKRDHQRTRWPKDPVQGAVKGALIGGGITGGIGLVMVLVSVAQNPGSEGAGYALVLLPSIVAMYALPGALLGAMIGAVAAQEHQRKEEAAGTPPNSEPDP